MFTLNEHVEFLGVVLDTKLIWNAQKIEESVWMCIKSGIFALRNLKLCVSYEYIIFFYFHRLFCIILYLNFNKKKSFS